MKHLLTPDEMRAVKFYEGDIPARDRDDPFWGDARAYVTLNALLYDDLATEYTRVREGKTLNPEMLRDLPRLRNLYAALFSAARKGVQSRSRTGYRVERAADFDVCLQNGMTCAFTSTSLGGFLTAYGDKQDIVLLVYQVPAGTPLMIFSELLDSYGKAGENEMLLPPFLRFDAQELPLNGAALTITDLNGAPPKAAYEITVRPTEKTAPVSDTAALPEVYPAVCRLYGQIGALLPETALDPDDRDAYLQCKQAIRQYLQAL